jgi:ParB family chromosome partitioning protein
MTTMQNIALNKLVMSKANVRKTDGGEGLGVLAASIAAHGLRQNLNVREGDKGRFEVVAGGRRLRALKKLVKDGLMAKDAEIPCRVLAEGEDASEISLVENTLREPMHPDDQFVAFRQLVEAGKSVEDVAARFGVTPAVVERRLKLARVSPKLRVAFRKGELTLEQMMAFAVSDDHEQQEDVARNLTHWNSTPRDIRAALTQEAVALTEPLARFVTAETYLAAGGVIQRDMFDENNEGYMADRALALSLANYRLEAALADIKAEGWKWAKAEIERDYSVYYGRVQPTYDGEGEERKAHYAAEDIARAGVILRIGHNGELAVERGLVHPDERDTESRGTRAKEPKDAAAIPASVVKELSAHRTAAMQAALAQNPEVALAVTVFTLALPLFCGSASNSCLQISVKKATPIAFVSVRGDCDGYAAMEAEEAKWGDRVPVKPADLFTWCLEQPQDVLLSLLAFCAASGLNAIKEKVDAETSPRLAHADALAAALSLDMAAHWTPSVEGFYGKLTKAGLLTVAKDAKAELAIVVGNVKKEAAARHVMQAVAGTGWVPAALGGRTASQGDGELAHAA